MLTKAIQTRIFQLQYISCRKPQHQGQDLSIVCLNMQCEKSRVLCCHCDEQEHQGHRTVPLKQYLMDVYLTKILNKTQKVKISNANCYNSDPFLNNVEIDKTNFSLSQQLDQSHAPQTNYLSFISNIETYKLSALKSLQAIKQKFLDQLTDIEVEITSSANKYIQKTKSISEINFGRIDLIEKLEKFNSQSAIYEFNSLINRYVNDYNLIDSKRRTQQQIDRLIGNNNRKNLLSTNYETHQQLVKVQQAFKNKIQTFQNTLKFFDFQFIRKLLKIATFEDINFNQFSTVYEWDYKMKAINFEICKNNKIIRGIKNSVGCERFAFMKIIFPTESIQKFKWAVKINNLAGWISVGVGLRRVIFDAKLKFNYSSIGHGSYMISDNGYSWSHSSAENNSKKQSFNFLAGDVIVIEFDVNKRELKFKKIINKGQQQSFTMFIAEYTKSDELSPCVNMCSVKDEVEIVAVPT